MVATKNMEAMKQGRVSWKLPLTAVAAASYYLLTGPSHQAHKAVLSSSSGLIHQWLDRTTAMAEAANVCSSQQALPWHL